MKRKEKYFNYFLFKLIILLIKGFPRPNPNSKVKNQRGLAKVRAEKCLIGRIQQVNKFNEVTAPKATKRIQKSNGKNIKGSKRPNLLVS